MTGLHGILKQTIAEPHRRIETVGLHERMASGQLSRKAYGSYIGALAVVHAVVEAGLEHGAHPLTQVLRGCAQPKLCALTEALRGLSQHEPSLRARSGAVDLALRFAGHLLEGAERDSLSLVGTLYVLEGSQNGGVLLRETAMRGLGMSPETVSYFGFYGRETKANWKRFVAALEQVPTNDTEVDTIASAARGTFAELHAILRAAIDEAPPLLVSPVAPLNAEAGSHEVASDPILLAAALQAGVKARAAFPYLTARYGLRGIRFTASDSCWLVRLTSQTPVVARGQIAWLRRVLAVRGIPSIIMEQHLEMIAERLGALLPDDATAFVHLHALAAFLRDDRSKHLPAHRFAALADAYEPRFATCPGLRVPGAARVLLAAWADRGIVGEAAWTSVLSWFMEPGRFSGAWRSVVRALSDELTR